MSPQPNSTCFACGSQVRSEGARRAQCSNPQCPFPGTRYLCEFCNQFSVTPQLEGLVCNNSKCRMYNGIRKGCPQCRKISLISYQGMDQCLNRRCPTNVGRFTKCIFCGRDAMYVRPEFGICIKAHCSHFLVPVNRCFFCGEMSYNREKMMCENAQCRLNRVRVELCPDCGSRSRVADPSHPENGKCLDPSCSARKASSESADKPLAMSGTFMLGPDQMRELDRIIGSAKRDAPEPPVPLERTMKMPDVGGSALEKTLVEPSEASAAPAFGIDPNNPRFEPTTDLQSPPASPARGRTGARTPSMEDTLSMSSASGHDMGLKKAPAGGGGGSPALEETMPNPVPSGPVPPPGAAVPPRTAGGGQIPSSGSSLEQAFEFIKEYVLVADGGMAPVYLVIGTAGAGKTTYLTMLGEILRARETKYHFPYEGVDVRRIQVEQLLEQGKKAGRTFTDDVVRGIKSHVRDLVFDFAQSEYSSTISRGHWPEQTPPDEASSKFLVTELTRYQKPIARIVTFETSGEDFEAALKGITAYDPTKTTSRTVHRMIYELMDMASGFVILMTPEGRENDQIYRDFFLAIRDGLEPQAMNVLCAEIKKKLQKRPATAAPGVGEVEAGQFTMMIRDVRRLEEDGKRKEQEFQKHRMAYTNRVRELRIRLKQGELDVLDGTEGQFLKEMERMVGEMHADQLGKVRNVLKERGMSRENILAYYAGLLDMAEKEIDEIVRRREFQGKDGGAGEGYSAEEIERALWEVRQQCRVSEGFRIDPGTLQQSLDRQREVRRFKWLRRLSIAFTKTDMYPSTYPPENHPARNLPDSKIYLDTIVDYLHLLGGRIRFYNASTTGYSILRDTLYVPGQENTLTPINIVEPIFDMLGIK